jgi:O-acetyl-ADP-ribose deacetylase (regulator of RNase III)
MSFKTIFCDLDRELVTAVHRQADMKGLDGRFQCYFGSFEALEREPSRFTHVVYTVTMEQPGTRYSKEESKGLVQHCVLNTLRATGGWNANGMPKIEWLVLPGFGTGIGGIPIEQAARETVLAYKEFFNGS